MSVKNKNQSTKTKHEARFLRREPVQRININIDMERTGARIKKAVKAKGYSIEDLMEATGVTAEQTVYKWYAGKSLPMIETLIVLSELLECAIRDLLVVSGEKEPEPAADENEPDPAM